MKTEKINTVFNRILLPRKGERSAAVVRWFPAGFGWAVICAFVATLPFSSLGEGTVSTNTEAALDEALAGGGEVTFEFDGTITVSNTKIISTDTVLDAGESDVTISGGNTVQIFSVVTNVSLTLLHLKLANGHTNTLGGAIHNRGDLSATDCVFTNNTAVGINGIAGTNGADASGAEEADDGTAGTAGGSVSGGAIYNSGTLALTDCVFQDNAATAGSGGSGGDGGTAPWNAGDGAAGGAGGMAKGGAIYSVGGLFITNCTFADNGAIAGSSGNGGSGGDATAPLGSDGSNARAGVPGEGSGAGIYTTLDCSIMNSSFYGNGATGGNAGTNGTFTSGLENDSGRNGGGSFGGGLCNVGSCLVVNSTFYTNTVVAGNGGSGSGAGATVGGAGGKGGVGSGGGLYSSGTNNVINCTFSSGAAKGGSGGAGGPSPRGSGAPGGNGAALGGNVARNAGTFSLQNSILASAGSGGNGNGTITDAGYNISSDSSISLSGTGSRISTDPKLDPLADNGGSTLTMALLPESPAIDAITNADAIYPPFDQREIARPSGLYCDIGAYEFEQFPIQGYITLDGEGLPGVEVTIGSRSTTTDATGFYTLSVVPGTYDVRPVAANYAFYPEFDTATVEDAPSELDFAATELFAISGRVFNGATGLAGVTVTLDSGEVTNTDASGNYRFSRLEAGSYEVTPSRPGYGFDPTTISVDVGPDANEVDFISYPTFTISGRVLHNGSTNGLADVTVDAGPDTEPAATDASGTYTISGLAEGTYEISASLDCYAFSPASHSVEVGPNTNGVNFAATPDVYAISGRVTEGGNGLNGVTVNGGGKSTVTDANGFYTLAGLCPGPYQVTPSRACSQFDPPSHAVTVGPNTNGVNFAAAEVYSISGRVVDGTNGLSGVTVQIGTNAVATDVNGNFTLCGLRAGAYVVMPSFTCYQFEPANRTIEVGPSANGVDFMATRGYTISGRIAEGMNGLSGVSVKIQDTRSTYIVVTTNGNYTLSGICPSTYSITPSKAGYEFEPPSLTVAVGPNTNVDFAAFQLFTLSGQIGGTNGLSGAIVTVAGGGITNTVVSTNGNYSVSGLRANSYTVTPSLACYQFEPANRVVVVGPSTNGVNFTPVYGFTISGNITEGVNGLSGVSVAVVGGGVTNVVVTTNGSYTVSGLCPGNYSATPTLACYQFSPSSRAVTVGPNASGVNFTAAHGFSISGRITEGGNGLNGVTVLLTNGGGVITNITVTNGTYDFPGVCPGTYTVTPSLGCHQFSPPSHSGTVGPSVGGKDFVAYSTDVFTIRGRVTLDGSNGLSGVTVSNANSTAVTDINGNYVLTRVCLGPCVVTPVLGGYGFTPGSRPLTIEADANGVDFVAFPVFTITGRVVEGTNGLTGVSVTAIGGSTTNTVLSTNGNYTISGLRSNTYTVTPALVCYLFNPTNRLISVGPANAINADFAAIRDVQAITGRIMEGAVGLGGVTVQAGGQTTNTDASGYYALSGLCPGVYTVTPTEACHLFFPTSRSVTLGQGSSGADFVAYRNAFTVRGRITQEGAGGLTGVKVSAGSQTQVTDADGNYALPDLCPGFYTITPSLTGYKFAPTFIPVTLGSDTNGLNFSAFPGFAINRGTNGLMQLLFGASPAMNYRIEASTNLVNWETILVTNNLASTMALFQFVDADSARFPARFYRLAENLLILINRTGGSVRLSFAVVPECNYQIRASTNLVNWQIIFTTNFATTNLSIATGLFQFTDAGATNFPARFYQLYRY